jgi:23S rRNA (guanosine2251-2'-O)-methyltransferase
MQQSKFKSKPNYKPNQKSFGNKNNNQNSGQHSGQSSENFLLANQVCVYGKHPVFAALGNKKRKIYQILVSKNSEAELKQFIVDNKINCNQNLIRIVDNDYINSLLPIGSTHQGFVLKTSPITLISYNQFLDKIAHLTKENLPPILILDSLTDPHNIGAIIRSSVAFGFKNIVVTQRNFPLNSPVIAKTASGMLEIVDLIAAQNLNSFLADLKKAGYWSVGLDGEAKTDISTTKNYSPIALVLGSEGEGIRRLVKENCDLLVKININQEVESLNASNAAAITMYELSKHLK